MNLDFLVAIFFPRRCAGCGRLTRTERGIRPGVLCEPCGRTLFVPRMLPFDARVLHYAAAAGSYDNPTLKALIHILKFRGVRAAAEPLAELLVRLTATYRLAARVSGCLVTPIPLSHKRFRARGFNQSELIAAQFAHALNLHLETRILMRAKHAKPQSGTKNLAERKENIRGCFAVRDAAQARGKHFLLIDDVTTSGSTLHEAARTLTDAGAARVVALTVAQV